MLWDRVRRALRRRRTRVAVVVTVGPGQERHLAACLASLEPQLPRPSAVLLAPWGAAWGGTPPTGLPDRVRVLPFRASANAARNGAADAVTADAVLLLEATELLRPDGLARLTGELGRGVRVVGGAADELAERLWRPAAVPQLDERHGRFPDAALVGEPGVRLPDRVADGTDRTWGVPFGFVPRAAPELPSLTALVADRLPATRVARVAPAFLDDLEHAADGDVAALAEALRARPELTTDTAIPVETRLRTWLVAHGHREAMSRLTVARWFEQGQFPTRVDGGRVHAVIDVPGVDVPAEVLALTPTLVPFLARAAVRDGRLAATVFATVPEVDLAAHRPEVTAELVDAAGDRVPVPVTRRDDPAATRQAGREHQSQDAGAMDLEIDLAGVTGERHLEVTVQVAGLRLTAPVAARDERGSAGLLGRRAGPVRFDAVRGLVVGGGSRGDAGGPASEPPGDVPVAVSVDAGEERLVVRGRCAVPFDLALCLGARRVAADVAVEGGSFTATVPWTWDPWRLGPTALPSGTWHLAWSAGARSGDLPIAPGSAGTTPHEWQLSRHRVTLRRGLRGQVLVQLAAPLADDEAGPWAQARLREAYAATSAPLDEGLALFSSYAGTAATDSPRAIFEELHRRRPGLRCLWTVADHSVAVPDGATPVLLRSREWYEALARAALVVTNVEVDRFFRTRPGQRLVQTFHGYPSKAMGLGLWRMKNFSPLRQARQLADTAGTWSLALTPTPEMSRHYREQYLFEGPFLDRGYPRDDALLAEDAADVRAAARARLGLGDDDVAVLYAPTWRDDLATDYRAAPLVSHLDVAGLAEGLGPDHVVLLRGHRFHQPPGSRARVLDVSTYPEINDLVLAADAAVLDYSSLRFDAALTGLPMVFLVPDLDEYAGAHRGFLFPFTESTPGPLVTTTDEVVEQLRDLPGLRSRHADRLASFNARFNAHQDGRAAARVVDALLGGPAPTIE